MKITALFMNRVSLSAAIMVAFWGANGAFRGKELPYKSDGGCSSYPLGVKNEVLIPLRVFSFKTSSVVPFVVPLRVEIW